MEKKNLDEVKSQFGREAEKYVVSRVHSNQDDLDFVVNFINPSSDWKAIDIATGTGHLAHALSPYVGSIISSDITKEMLEQSQKIGQEKGLSNFSTATVDVHDIQFQNGYFDLVTVRIAPHHFHDIDKAINEMMRITKSGGKIFVQDTVAPSDPECAAYFNHIEKLRDHSHVRDLSKREWQDKFIEQGCKIIKVAEREKEWPLGWWTGRMSTPEDKVKEIIRLLDEKSEDFEDFIKIVKDQNGEYIIYPHNIYLLAEKL